ncbi:polymerase [Diaporthe helianthi]|uniref:Polymerase n=1 Tax=Diaporthe helianthi TaxID=158607 RepID=A0A2P5HJT0_DIAHE|nr:polymerase [Diaporthe helianthi]
MSLKQFNADVRSARSLIDDGQIPGVFAIERGDADGEVVVTVAHEKIPSLLPIQILVQDIAAYPSDHNFLVFTASEDTPNNVVSALEGLQDCTSGMKLAEVITTVSTCIDHGLRSINANPDMTMEDQDYEHISDDLAEEYFSDDFSDDQFGLTSMHTNIQNQSRSHSRLSSSSLQRIKLDLRSAREAGCRVGVLDGLQLSSSCHIFSLSIRASKLGLSEEALEAWHVNIMDHIILLVRIKGSYPYAEHLLENPCVNFNVDFRFGKGKKYKPSAAQAHAAFLAAASRKHGASEHQTQSLEDDQGRTFEKTFISDSLEQFMNEQCLHMIKLRLQNLASSWDDANEQFRKICTESALSDDLIAKANIDEEVSQFKSKPTDKERSTRKSKGKQREMPTGSAAEIVGETPSPKPIPNFLMRDATATRPLGQCSIPLIVMQFAVHYFSRCTEYCLRCHQHVGTEFEALKPFVCSNPLCLFQYLAMGFGPSIEHEILTQPYVVDLLVSLCYSSIRLPRHWTPLEQAPPSYRIREFPCGLHLKVPASSTAASGTGASGNTASTWGMGTTAAAANEVTHTTIKVMADLQTSVVTISTGDLGLISSDTWIILREGARHPYTEPAYHHGRVRNVDRQTRTLEVDFNILETPRASGVIEMDLLLYDTEFDDLNDHVKANSMVTVLKTLPPILSLREYLVKNPQSRLRSYAGISPAAATLLEWIVTSNRSCLLQVTPVEDSDPTLLDQIKTREQEAIPSLKNLVQFRFAQGAPDKESRFHRALKEIELENSEYPTLFAWHGSALSNWHSILRFGLDFKNVVNGRAYGNGVYFSQDYRTSQGYAASDATSSWPRSALNISSVISLCEIVNAPKRFVSTSPHLVVGQVDWIQCRYLFAQRSPVHNRTTGQPAGPVASAVVPTSSGDVMSKEPAVAQDPARTVLGPDSRPLSIPLRAVTTRKQQTAGAASSSKRDHGSMSFSEETDEEGTSDIEFLFHEDVSLSPPAKRPNSARESSVDTATGRRVTTQRPLTPPQTDFRAGRLDLGSLPRLPLPAWASGHSTKRLSEQILHMQRVQARTPPHELGWYIDFDSMENIFQWIVEFHSFDPELPLAKDMKKADITSIVLEVRFGRDYPFSPPFVRMVRPRFLPFASGGGGHITIGGAICMELLTSSGWLPTISMDIVFVSIRTAISETERPARLQTTATSAKMLSYGASEALDAYIRFAGVHGWAVPKDLQETASQ